MRIHSYSLIRCLAMAFVLSGLTACASSGAKKPASGYAELMGAAEADVVAGRAEAALSGFEAAAKADPTRKEPWVRSAQLQFDAGNYGRAIVAAEEVLRRDPADKVADSVLTVGGLRVASQSLQRLQGNGALASETARREAEQLRSTMIATMGNEFVIGEDSRAKPKAPVRRPARAAAPGAAPATPATAPRPSAPASSSGSNPFD